LGRARTRGSVALTFGTAHGIAAAGVDAITVESAARLAATRNRGSAAVFGDTSRAFTIAERRWTGGWWLIAVNNTAVRRRWIAETHDLPTAHDPGDDRAAQCLQKCWSRARIEQELSLSALPGYQYWLLEPMAMAYGQARASSDTLPSCAASA
jgi:hypothetical protein